MTPNIWFLATTRVDFKWLADFNTGKTQTCFVWLIWQLYCYWCENGWVCSWKKNYLSRCWDCLCYLNSTGALTLSLLLKVPPRKIELWFVLWNVFLRRLLFIYINEPYNLVWNVVMSGLVLSKCNLNILDKLQNQICRIVVLSLAAVLNSWLIVEI